MRNLRRLSLVVATVTVFNSSIMTSSEASAPSRPMECAHPRWRDRWATGGIKPGVAWDTGSVSPALQQAIDLGTIPNGKALVPGCGRGYDVHALASSRRYVLGIDIVPKAVDEANIYLKENRVISTQGEVKVLNFFELSTEPEDKFDFIYDYTFLCALEPSIRHLWAEQMGRLINPGGELFCLIFPINDLKEGGPPFKLNLNEVKKLLENEFECKQLELLPSHLCHKDRDGTNPLLGNSGIGRFVKK